jgi:hypothetical protein
MTATEKRQKKMKEKQKNLAHSGIECSPEKK